MGTINKAIRKLAIFMIGAYRLLLSPVLGNHCRYLPSCSQYTQNAIEKYGILRGCWLGSCRLLRCHPWHPGGYDPVPDNEYTQNTKTR